MAMGTKVTTAERILASDLGECKSVANRSQATSGEAGGTIATFKNCREKRRGGGLEQQGATTRIGSAGSETRAERYLAPRRALSGPTPSADETRDERRGGVGGLRRALCAER